MNTRAGPTPSDRPFPSPPSTKTNDAIITTTNVAQHVDVGVDGQGRGSEQSQQPQHGEQGRGAFGVA
jgi:hypothetical protein